MLAILRLTINALDTLPKYQDLIAYIKNYKGNDTENSYEFMDGIIENEHDLKLKKKLEKLLYDIGNHSNGSWCSMFQLIHYVLNDDITREEILIKIKEEENAQEEYDQEEKLYIKN